MKSFYYYKIFEYFIYGIMRLIMRQKYLFLLVSFAVSLASYGKVKTYKSPASLYSNVRNLSIDKVVISDTATLLACSFEGKAGSWLQWAPTTVLSDDKKREYPLRNVSGVGGGEKLYVPDSGKVEFQLNFAPMPDNTKIFDLVEGTNKKSFRIYGIHDAKSSIKIPVAEEEDALKEIADFLFEKNTAVVRGKIEGYSRQKGYGVAIFEYRTFDDPHGISAPCVCIQEDGTFSAELLLDHPLWAGISTGGDRPQIPFYVCPGDTLDITVKGLDKGRMSLEYATTRPEGCCETLLKHEVPVIYSEWEKDGENAFSMSDDAFLNMTGRCLDENGRLCDYLAWKYGFSPREVRLAKNKYRCSVVFNHLVLANNIYRNRSGMLKGNMEQQACSLYGIMNRVPLNDVSLAFLPYFPDNLSLMGQMIPIALCGQFTSVDDGDYLQRIRKENDSQVAAFRDMVHMQDVPWMIQCFLMNKVWRIPDRISVDKRKDIVNEISKSLTYPYLKNKIVEMDSAGEYYNAPAYRLPENQSVSSILSQHSGKYVQMVCLSSLHSDVKFCASPNVENLVFDFKDNPDLEIVFVFNGYEYSEEQFKDVMSRRLPKGSNCIRLDFECYLDLQRLFCSTRSQKQMTFDKNGLALRYPLDMNNESLFRYRFRRMTPGEK